MNRFEIKRVMGGGEGWLGYCSKNCGYSVFVDEPHNHTVYGDVHYYSHKKCPKR